MSVGQGSPRADGGVTWAEPALAAALLVTAGMVAGECNLRRGKLEMEQVGEFHHTDNGLCSERGAWKRIWLRMLMIRDLNVATVGRALGTRRSTGAPRAGTRRKSAIMR